MNAQGFVDAYRAMGISDAQVADILGDKAAIQDRLNAGETWEDLLAGLQSELPW